MRLSKRTFSLSLLLLSILFTISQWINVGVLDKHSGTSFLSNRMTRNAQRSTATTKPASTRSVWLSSHRFSEEIEFDGGGMEVSRLPAAYNISLRRLNELMTANLSASFVLPKSTWKAPMALPAVKKSISQMNVEFIFCATGGRSGTAWLASLFDLTSRRRYVVHEPPLMDMGGDTMRTLQTRTLDDTYQQRASKAARILQTAERQLTPSGVYVETNARFVHSFADVVMKELGVRVGARVTVLVPHLPVAEHVCALVRSGLYTFDSGTDERLLGASSPNFLFVNAPLRDDEMDEYDRVLAHLVNVDVRVRALRDKYERLDNVRFIDVDMTRLWHSTEAARHLFGELHLPWTEAAYDFVADGTVVDARAEQIERFDIRTSLEYCRLRVREFVDLMRARRLSLPSLLSGDSVYGAALGAGERDIIDTVSMRRMDALLSMEMADAFVANRSVAVHVLEQSLSLSNVTDEHWLPGSNGSRLISPSFLYLTRLTRKDTSHNNDGVVGLLVVRNAGARLHDFLDYHRRLVDTYVVLDDSDTNDTLRFLQRHGDGLGVSVLLRTHRRLSLHSALRVNLMLRYARRLGYRRFIVLDVNEWFSPNCMENNNAIDWSHVDDGHRILLGRTCVYRDDDKISMIANRSIEMSDVSLNATRCVGFRDDTFSMSQIGIPVDSLGILDSRRVPVRFHRHMVRANQCVLYDLRTLDARAVALVNVWRQALLERNSIRLEDSLRLRWGLPSVREGVAKWSTDRSCEYGVRVRALPTEIRSIFQRNHCGFDCEHWRLKEIGADELKSVRGARDTYRILNEMN